MTAAKKSATKAAVKDEKKWQRDIHTLQAAMLKLKKGLDAIVDLSTLPILRRITGAETNVDKIKLIKAAIKDAHWKISNGAALAIASRAAIQEEKRIAAAKLAVVEKKKMKKTRPVDAAAKEGVPKSSPQRTATPSHYMHLRSDTKAGTPVKWTPVAPQNSNAAKKAAARGSVGAVGPKIATAAPPKAELAEPELETRQAAWLEGVESSEETEIDDAGVVSDEGDGWHNQFQQGFRGHLTTSWADEVQRFVKGSKGQPTPFSTTNTINSKILPETTQVNKAFSSHIQPQKAKKLDKRAKQRALAALAVLAGESENVIEAEAQHEYADVIAGSLPIRPSFCGDQLGLPIASLFTTLKQQTDLEIAADHIAKQKLARERVVARRGCIDELSHIFPAEAMTAHISIVGYALHPRASLLGLTEEIQEQIYRAVLVEDSLVRITPSHHEQPALLRTCQQLRMESLWIFEIENTFSIEVVDSQPVVPKNYTSHWARQVPLKLETKGVPKWDSLKKWLKSYHEDGVLGLNDQGAKMSLPWDICGQAFELVLRLRELFPDITFEEMGPMLEVWKRTVTLQQVSWSWE